MVDLKLKLPDGFLDEEERCGYLVSKKMKEVWAVELDLFAEFDRVCRKYDIQYFASSGTMLGAVRHHGFIPWDDDMDVMMMRDQYEKLCKIAEKEFSYPYFFQTEYTDPGSLRGHAQLRNSMTTGGLVEEIKNKVPINQGIFFDIFPLDAIPDDELERKRFLNKIMHMKQKLWKKANFTIRYLPARTRWKRPIKYLLHGVLSLLIKPEDIKMEFRHFEQACQQYNDQETKYVDLISFRGNDKFKRRRCHFKTRIYVPFEFLQMPICKDYDAALTNIFGNWHKLVKGTSLHGGVIFDTGRPYTDYLKGKLSHDGNNFN